MRRLRDYLDNARKVGWVGEGKSRRRVDRRRPGIPMPLEYALVLLGERFGVPPWELEKSADGGRIMHYLNLIGLAEGIKFDLEPLGVDGVMFWDDED